jgi:hypothetical protein
MEDGASMLSTPTIKETDVQSPVTIDPEVVLAARADRVALTAGADAARRPLDRQASHGEQAPTPALDTTFRPADLHGRRPAGGRSSVVTWALRTGLAVMVAVCSAVAAAGWQTYGDQAQEIVARWMPHVSLSAPADKGPPAQPAAPMAPASADDQTQAAPATAQTAEAAAPATATAATSTEPTQDSAPLLQSMAHDLTAMSQQIADLKASIAQLKAGQDQMVRDISRVSESKAPVRAAEAKPFDPRAIEQTLRPRPAARPPASSVATAAPVHRPRPVYSAPAQPISAAPVSPAPMPLPPAPPPQAMSDPGVDAVVRPPMPVR